LAQKFTIPEHRQNGVTTFEWTKKLRDLSINFKS
jgi:hypothetical protein